MQRSAVELRVETVRETSDIGVLHGLYASQYLVICNSGGKVIRFFPAKHYDTYAITSNMFVKNKRLFSLSSTKIIQIDAKLHLYV